MNTNYNSTVVCGRLVWDTKLKRLADGTEASVGTIATSHTFMGKAGKRSQHIALVPVITFGEQALILTSLHQGQHVFAIGHLLTEALIEAGKATSRLVLVCHELRPFLQGLNGVAKVSERPDHGDDQLPSRLPN